MFPTSPCWVPSVRSRFHLLFFSKHRQTFCILAQGLGRALFAGEEAGTGCRRGCHYADKVDHFRTLGQTRLVILSSSNVSMYPPRPLYRRHQVHHDLGLKAPRVEEEMTLQFADVLTISPPPEMENPGIMYQCYTEEIENAAGQSAHPILYTATAEDFGLHFPDLCPDIITLRKTDDGTGKVSISCRGAWAVTETVAASQLSWRWGGLFDVPYLRPTIIGSGKLSFSWPMSMIKPLPRHVSLNTPRHKYQDHSTSSLPQPRLVLTLR